MRLAYGIALLVRPDLVCRPFSGGPVDRPSRVFARVLGARQVVEALVLRRHRRRNWVLGGAAVDGMHALTMLGVAARDRRHRRLALANAAVAAGFAAEGALSAWSSPA
jgi:CHASE2 domain-containing sensor protein